VAGEAEIKKRWKSVRIRACPDVDATL